MSNGEIIVPISEFKEPSGKIVKYLRESIEQRKILCITSTKDDLRSDRRDKSFEEIELYDLDCPSVQVFYAAHVVKYEDNGKEKLLKDRG